MVKLSKYNLLVLLVCTLVACKSDSKYSTVDDESEFQLNIATSVDQDDVLILNNSHRIPYACPLDLRTSKLKNGIKIASYFILDMKNTVPTLGDLKPKYIMKKKKNESIVYAIKVGDTLAFKLIDYPKKTN